MRWFNMLVMVVTTIALLPAVAAAALPADSEDSGSEPPHGWVPGEPCEFCVACFYAPVPLFRTAPDRPGSDFTAQGFAAVKRPQEKPSFLSRAWQFAGGYIVPGILAAVIVAASTR